MHLIFRLFLFIIIPLYGLGGQFLTIPFDANEISLGSHPTINQLSYLNPALYSVSSENPSFSCSRGSWLGDVSIASLNYNQNMKGKTFYFGARYSGLSDLEFRGEKPQDEPLAYFSSYGLSLKSGFSVKRENIKYGIALSYVSMGIYTNISSGFCMEFGSLINLKKDFRLGFSIQNIGKMSLLNDDSPKLPQRYLIGVSKLFNFLNVNNIIYNSMEVNNISQSLKYKYTIGNKFSWRQLDILNGVSFSKNSNSISVGLGLNFKKYDITYGINIGSHNIAVPHVISLRFDMP